MSFDASNSALTNVIQLPAIAVNGKISICQPDLLKLDKHDLDKMAMVMGGQLLFVKFRATYTELETPLCNFEECFRPVKSTLWCDDHENGKTHAHVPSIGLAYPRASRAGKETA